MSIWIWPKCNTRNGQFDLKCFDCGKKQPAEFTPTFDELKEHKADSKNRSEAEVRELNRIGNRFVLGLIGGFISSIVVGGIWFLGNTQTTGPMPVVSFFLSILLGAAIGSAVWFSGRGFSILYGFIGSGFALMSALVSQALIYTHYLALAHEREPSDYLLSFDPAVYISGFKFGFAPLDICFYCLIVISAWWFSWRSGPNDSRLDFLSVLGTNNTNVTR